jgi:hypothetical protein
MNKIMILCALTAALSGCGGGAADAGPASTSVPASASAPPPAAAPAGPPAPAAAPPAAPAAPAAPASSLTRYLGTWVGECQGKSTETIVISLATDGSPHTSTLDEYYEGAACTGAVLGTVRTSQDFISTYTGSVDTVVALTRAPSTPVNVQVDRFTTTIAPYVEIRTGPWVAKTDANGQTSQCLQGSQGSTCYSSDSATGGYSFDVGLYLNGNELYILNVKNDVFSLDAHYTRKP